jgi:hypothetical protein
LDPKAANRRKKNHPRLLKPIELSKKDKGNYAAEVLKGLERDEFYSESKVAMR